MSTDATSGQSNNGFFKKIGKGIGNAGKSIGKWFNKNGDTVGNVMSALGNTAMQTGMTLGQIEMMKHGSIWGMGYMSMSLGMPMGYGMGFYSNCDPLGVSGWMGTQGYGTDPHLTYMGNQMAYNMGAATMQQIMAQNNSQNIQYNQYFSNLTNNNTKLKTDFAKLDISNQSTIAGKDFDKATDELTNEGEAVSGKKFSFGLTKGENSKIDAANYNAKVQETAKSYLAHIDTEYGDKDGGISLEEFTKHEMSKLKSDATDSEKAQAKSIAQNAFKKMDLNGDNKLDWKEYSAVLATFDQKFGGTELDGQITSEDYAAWSADLSNPYSTKFNNAARTNYLQMFKKQDD